MSEPIPGYTIKKSLGCGGSIHITYCPGHHVFVKKGKSGACLSALNEAIGQLASKLITLGHKDFVIEQLKGVKCSSPSLNVDSCPDAIAKALEQLDEKYKEKGGSI